MPRKSNDQKLAEIHAEMLREFDAIQEAVRDERIQCLEDRRFSIIAGAMWEGPESELFQDRPRFEVNKIDLGILRIQSEYRNNRISANFVSKDGDDDALADSCDALYRADCNDSGADEAKDNAFDEAARGGYGALRLATAYEDELDDEDERQRIRFEPINDADSCVFFGLEAKRQDKSDAKTCHVLTPIPTPQYIEEYGDDPATWPKDVTRTEFDWSTPDVVWVDEYYRIEVVKHKVMVYETITGEEERYTQDDLEDEDDNLAERLAAVGTKLVREKTTKRRRVHKYIASGGKILEDCGYIAGPNIPIVPVYGKRYVVDGVERCAGYTRTMKDITRLKNMQLSTLGQIAALSPMEKPILGAEQIANPVIRMMWEQDNLNKYPYLMLDAVTDSTGQKVYQGPLGYTKPPQIPPALAALMQITEIDLQDLMGNQQQADKLVSNISGKAVEAIKSSIDMQTYIYISNFAKAEKRAAEIWLGMAREVYVEDDRKMRAIGSQGETENIILNRPVIGKDGVFEYENDLTRADFLVTVEVGPSSSTRREAMTRDLTNMLAITSDPETQQVLQALIMYNMEGEGMAEYRDYWRKKLLRMGVVEPTEEEAQKMAQEAANQPPDANAQYLQAAAEEAQANATQARAKTVLTVAQAEETKAKTMKTLSEVDAAEQTQALEAIDRIGQLPPSQVQAPEVPMANSQGWQLHQDANGNLAYVGPNGEIEEVR